MSSVKIHAYRGDNDGTDSCDFRGDKFIGGEVDAHRTLLEVDPASAELVAVVLAEGPAMNRIFEGFKSAEPTFADQVATLLGLEGHGVPGLRIGVWDE